MMTEQRLQEMEHRLTLDVIQRHDLVALIAEVRRLQQEQDRQRIARIEAIEQGNSLAQRLIEQRDGALAERDAARQEARRWQKAFPPAEALTGVNTVGLKDDVALCFKQHAEQRERIAQLEADLAAARAEVTRLYDELGRVSEELGLPRSIGPAPGWLKQQMADLKEARQLLATRVEADRLSEANDEIAALKSALESAAVGLGQSRVDRIAELENEVKTLRVFANAALEHQREAESALDARLLAALLSGNALDDTIVERDEAHAALTEARRVLREVEWRGHTDAHWCPWCGGKKNWGGHATNCILAAVFAQDTDA